MIFSRTKFNFYKWIIIFLFFQSMYPWFTLNLNIVTFYLIIIPILIAVNFKSGLYKINGKRHLTVALFSLLTLWEARGGSPFAYVQALGCTYVIGSIVYLRNDLKNEIIPLLTKVFAIILGISLIAYLLYMIGIPFSYQLIEYRNYTLQNFYFFVTHWGNFFRFQGPFLEPGHVTMGLAPILFINRYNLKNRYVLILLVSQILTLSLAGYITLVIGYSLQTFLDGDSLKSRTKSVFVSVLFASGALFLLESVLGESILEEKILSRLEWNGSKLSGDDRSSDMLDFEYEKSLRTGQALTGDEKFDQTKLEKGVSGYKLYIVRHGLLGSFLAVLAYILSITEAPKGKKKPQILLCILLFMLFLQNAYPIWWCMIICAFMGGPYLLNSKNINHQ